jgi:hypothetical protein
MDALILTRIEGEHLGTFEGKRVVPLDSANDSGHYREWLVGVSHTDYCIVNEGDTWTLLAYDPDRGAWCHAPDDVDAFLTTHKLILAA